jgi:hypothetical protein
MLNIARTHKIELSKTPVGSTNIEDIRSKKSGECLNLSGATHSPWRLDSQVIWWIFQSE